MAEAELEVQKAIFDALAAAGATPYDRIPLGAVFPYWGISDCHVMGDLAQGYDGSEVHCTLHGWSRAVGKVEIKAQAGLVRRTLAPLAGGPPPFALVTHQLITWTYESTLYLDDPDGITRHAVVTIQYLTRPF